MDSTGLKRRDTTKGPPLRILSLDGGGVRGYSMLIIIQEIMHNLYVEMEGKAPRRSEIPKPADHFDLIVGTGTGGLIALMLGRLRLDLEECKELYVRLTRMVFETDKTIAGIPYRSTLFKASKLEEAIMEAVQEHTVYVGEGNDGEEPDVVNPLNPAMHSSAARNPQRHLSNASVVSFSARSPQAQMAPRPNLHSRYGNPHARLYDRRENRTKTAVTAVYQGSPRGMPPAMLRSYDSRKEPAPEFDVKIWEAGRATCSIGLAFKPIQIGQSKFHDDGGGTFNPAPEALDEAVANEWPGREVGVFISVGTGKRPKSSDSNSTQWYEGFMGDYAEARKRLIAKIEGCEVIHERMVKEYLGKRGVNIENYYRLNVEIGVGEFGMNEWHRLGEISTGTRKYLKRPAEHNMVQGSAIKLAKIHFAAKRFERSLETNPSIYMAAPTPPPPNAIELPAEMPINWPAPQSPLSRSSFDSGQDLLHVPTGSEPSPRSSSEQNRTPSSPRPAQGAQPASANKQRLTPPGLPPRDSGTKPPKYHEDPDRLVVSALTPDQYRTATGSDKISVEHELASGDYHRRPAPHTSPRPPPRSPQVPHGRIEPPPLPPKTPLPEQQQAGRGRRTTATPPYPLDDEAPPVVNMARKPDFRGR